MLVGPALMNAGIDCLSVRVRTHLGAIRIIAAVVYSEADEKRLRDWATDRGIVVLPDAVRVATPEEIEKHEQAF